MIEVDNMSGTVCEHCLIGIELISMMGRSRVYECEKGIHPKDCLAGFFEPCDGYPSCFSEGREKVKGMWVYNRKFRFRYKRIPVSQMKKSEDCIRDEKEEAEKRRKEVERLRKGAEDLLLKARELESIERA